MQQAKRSILVQSYKNVNKKQTEGHNVLSKFGEKMGGFGEMDCAFYLSHT